jgi:amino acid adenylation domain-containing protein
VNLSESSYEDGVPEAKGIAPMHAGWQDYWGRWMVQGLIGGFLKSVERFPERSALYVDGHTYTYCELGTLAAELAATILDADHGRYPLVAVLAHRSLTAYGGVLGAHCAGKGYVPLNPKFPVSRLLNMLCQCPCQVLIVGKEGHEALDSLLPNMDQPITIICPDVEEAGELAARHPLHRIIPKNKMMRGVRVPEVPFVAADDPAYLLFTSGSTGIPKGVPVLQRNVKSYIQQVCELYRITEQDRVSQMVDLSFDLSVQDMFMAWERGACLYCVPERSVMAPARFIRDHALTVWFSVPSIIGFMSVMGMLRPGTLPSLRVSLFCGEALPASYASAWQEAAPQSIIENLYGPTEATIAITRYRWNQTESHQACENGIVPIGWVYDGQRTCIVDPNLRQVPVGASGELCLSGSQITDGYWNNPSKTAEQFVRLPGMGETLWYRTGDLVKQDEAGCHYYLGRIDHQVKIRGHRIELQEIEHVLRRASHAAQVAAVAWPIKQGLAEGIVAFVFRPLTRDSDVIERACRETLPDYMVPKDVHFLDDIPLNANGKLDRLKLVSLLESGALPKGDYAQ